MRAPADEAVLPVGLGVAGLQTAVFNVFDFRLNLPDDLKREHES